MKTVNNKTAIKTAAHCVLALGFVTITSVHADTFGSGGNAFTVDFVTIGNAGNANDTGAGGGFYSSPYGGVPYVYRMGVTEVSQDWITKATNLGMTNVTAGAWAGNQPAANMTWYEAAAFVNWLNTSKGYQPAYQLDGTNTALTLWSSGDAWQLGAENRYRHKDAYYFLPSDNEWYKAAYHQNDGVTANYWDYPTGSNSIPDGIDSNGDPNYQSVFDDGYNQGQPNAITSAGSAASAYGTYEQGGNVIEWNESALDGSNDVSSESRTVRAGTYGTAATALRSSAWFGVLPGDSDPIVGFRVASVPEPSSTVLILSAGLLALARRRRTAL